MRATFSNSVDVLVRAYFDGTLEHGECHACAVGNLIQAGMGRRFTHDEEDKLRHHVEGWIKVFVTMGGGYQCSNSNGYTGIAKEQIDYTGYSWEDLARIEYAFESASRNGDWMFNGLMAVVDVLADLHGVDLSTKQSAVTRFEEIHVTK